MRNIWGGPIAKTITPEQCRQGRELLGWSIDDLSKLTGADVTAFEAGQNIDPEPIISAFAEYGSVYANKGKMVKL